MQTLTLSFDNGPDPSATPMVLDILGERGLKTVFFVLGHKLQDPACRRLVERAHQEGHWIGNHSWSHSGPFGRRGEPDLVDREIRQTEALIGDLAHPERYFRPQGGGGSIGPHLLNRAVAEHLQTERYTCVLWNAIPRDWADPDGWVELALAQSAERTNCLMVLHDLPTGAMRHLPRFLDKVAASGTEFRQEFPSECVPMARGQPKMGFARYITE